MDDWGELAFDNDTANDWSYALDDFDDLALVEEAFDDLEEVGAEPLEADVARDALAACEVLARLLGRHGYRNDYSANADRWVDAHPQIPSAALLARATAAIDRVLAAPSELVDLWVEADGGEKWRGAVADLRRRVTGS